MSKGDAMTFHALFWVMCWVVVAFVIVAIIAVAKAYRHDRKVTVRSVTPSGFHN